MNGGASLGDALQRPASTPFVPLIDACAEDLGLGEDPRVALLGRSTVLLYAYVRIQDDLVDEPELVPRAAVYVAEALLAEHLALFAAAVPDARAFALRSAVMRRFADVAAAEVAERKHELATGDSVDWMGGKFLPMAVPLVGMAVLAGRPALADTLIAFVHELGTALQLVNDVFNVAEDAAQGRPTPVLRWLGAAGRAPGGPPLRALLLDHPALGCAIDAARSHVERAAVLARSEGLPRIAAAAHRARDMVEAAPYRLLRLMLGAPVT